MDFVNPCDFTIKYGSIMTLNQNMLIILRFRIRWFTRNLCWHELPPKPIDTAFGSFGKGPHSVGFECNLTRAERGRRNGVVASAQKDLRKAEINRRALVLLLKNHAPSPNWFSAPKKTWCINLSIEVSNLFEQLDLPLMRTLQRNTGKHCKHKAKIHTDCTILHINYLPSSCGEPASTTCQTMWKGLSSSKIKIERASRNTPIDGKHAMNYSVCWFHQFIIPIGPVNCNHTVTSNQQNGFLSRLKPMPQMVGVKVWINLLNMKINRELPISHCLQKCKTSSTI